MRNTSFLPSLFGVKAEGICILYSTLTKMLPLALHPFISVTKRLKTVVPPSGFVIGDNDCGVDNSESGFHKNEATLPVTDALICADSPDETDITGGVKTITGVSLIVTTS